MTQINFRRMVECEVENSNKMDAGKFILELVKIEKVAKTQIDFLYECLERKGCNYHAALFCLYVFHADLIDYCKAHKKDILNIAKSEIKMFREEIKLAEQKMLIQKEKLEVDPMVRKISGKRKVFEALNDEERKQYVQKFNNLTELIVAHKSKLLNFAIACQGGTIVQDYEDGLIDKKKYVAVSNEYAKHIPEICEKYNLNSPATIIVNKTTNQDF